MTFPHVAARKIASFLFVTRLLRYCITFDSNHQEDRYRACFSFRGRVKELKLCYLSLSFLCSFFSCHYGALYDRRYGNYNFGSCLVEEKEESVYISYAISSALHGGSNSLAYVAFEILLIFVNKFGLVSSVTKS